jgi:2-C-methyl-D-erythritol 4-phosphate cytidylyltransferase
MSLTISRHAIQRFQERVENVSDEVVRARLSGKAFECAERFGAKYVLLHGGARAVIENNCIVTVLEKGMGVASHYGDIRGIVR